MKSVIAATILALTFTLAGTVWADSSGFSGYEFFPGVSINGLTVGASFFGWTNLSQSLGTDCGTLAYGNWLPYRDNSGGFVTGSINYAGKPGFGHMVVISGGAWSWLKPNGVYLRGRVLDGTVTWPDAADTNYFGATALGCGCGVAEFSAEVALGRRHTPAGSFEGCLDDQLSFPPKIWGIVTIGP